MKKISNIIYQVFLVCVVASFIFLSHVQAVVPPPDGGYPNGNTAEGDHALFSLTTGTFNAAVGWYSQSVVADGDYNTSVGAGALDLNTANANTAVGAAALLLNTSGVQNTATGAFALLSNSSGTDNTGIGAGALYNNEVASANTAVGFQAMYSHTDGGRNTAVGYQSLYGNGIGGGAGNTAIGGLALGAHISGDSNTAVGDLALSSDGSGFSNTAIGAGALSSNTSGSRNIAVGDSAGSNSTGDVNINIGNSGFAGESGTIRIGNSIDHARTFIAAIHSVNQGGTGILPVYINSAGQLGTSASSRRFKAEIKPMNGASEAIFDFKPVTFCYKDDDTKTPQFGLVAEDVAEVNPALIVRDKKGDIYNVRYDAVNAMLLNEFLKEHRRVEQQQAAISELKSLVQRQKNEFQTAIAEQQRDFEARLDEQNARIQKISAQLELRKPSPRTVADNP